jgi:tetraprenyl-beta-curcumene synthase
MPDPLSLSPRQVWVLLAAASRQLLWGLRGASLESNVWRERALSIPDTPIGEDALESIEHERGHADGAALFWILPPRRDPNLLRLLVRHQIIWDLLDCVNELAACEGTTNGRQLHLALIEALDPGAPIPDPASLACRLYAAGRVIGATPQLRSVVRTEYSEQPVTGCTEAAMMLTTR